MLGCVTLDLDPVDRGSSTVGGLGPRRYYILLRIMLCGSGYFLASWVRRGPSVRIAQGGLVEKSNVRTVWLVLTTGCQNLSEDPVLGSGLCPLSLSWKMSGPHSPGHETEAMPESSSHRQTNAASHKIIGNFMKKMTELLEATLTNRRGEQAQNTSNDEALERFLRFWPPEFHGDVEQEANAELFLE
ncbi:hypothetical protein M9H77_03537 [Catharanthus roseus]|uniref:Uncharacterized protein n=1 Tax=Catharanthus roseus TaxID=4058 RepID=A0ACC0CBH7_CATRO|nr:hypothetical protein M9H77_03537 [Catharanthus roseus]